MIWNTENMIEEFISIGMKAYKKNSKGSIEARKLDRHESVIIQELKLCLMEIIHQLKLN